MPHLHRKEGHIIHRPIVCECIRERERQRHWKGERKTSISLWHVHSLPLRCCTVVKKEGGEKKCRNSCLAKYGHLKMRCAKRLVILSFFRSHTHTQGGSLPCESKKEGCRHWRERATETEREKMEFVKHVQGHEQELPLPDAFAHAISGQHMFCALYVTEGPSQGGRCYRKACSQGCYLWRDAVVVFNVQWCCYCVDCAEALWLLGSMKRHPLCTYSVLSLLRQFYANDTNVFTQASGKLHNRNLRYEHGLY